MEELCDENVHLQDVGDVFSLHISQHVDEPLEVAVGRADPQEIHLRERDYKLFGTRKS